MNACTCDLSCETQMIERYIPWMPWLYPWGRMANGMSNPCVSCRSLWSHCFDSGRPGHGGCFCIADHTHIFSHVACIGIDMQVTHRRLLGTPAGVAQAQSVQSAEQRPAARRVLSAPRRPRLPLPLPLSLLPVGRWRILAPWFPGSVDPIGDSQPCSIPHL